MAASGCRYFVSTLFRLPRVRWIEGCSSFSVYSPQWESPVFQKDKLEDLVKNSQEVVLETMKVKAISNGKTCSIFYDEDIATFTNLILKKGKKELARDIVAVALTIVKHHQLKKYYAEKDEEIKEKIILSPREVFHEAIRNTTPAMKISKIRKGGVNYQVPDGIRPEAAKKQAMRWIIEASKDKPKYYYLFRTLAAEIIAAANKEGKAYKKKLELYKICEVNRGYAHLKRS